MRCVPLSYIAKNLGLSVDSSSLISGYQVDSRLLSEGELFVALKGKRVDGHQFLYEAACKGAIGAIVDKEYHGPDYGLFLLPVEDPVLALQNAAALDLEESGAKVVAITGSVGKTTTKDFLAELLQVKYRVGKTFANYNTEVSLPLSILNRKGEEEVFVLEMGSGAPGDIAKLLTIAKPDVAVVTKVALAHAAFFPEGLEQIAQEKASIFSSPNLRAAIFEKALVRFPSFSQVSQAKATFSLHEQTADYFLHMTESGWFLDERGVRAYRFDLPFKEMHIVHNLLAAICVARQMRLEWDEINARIPFLQLPKMRFECFEHAGITWINDAYNANPESMQAALSSIPNPKESGKRIGVLGVMFPLGSFSKQAHMEVGRFAQMYLDHLLVLGEEARPLLETFQEAKKPAELFTDVTDLADRLGQLVCAGDVVLVKGSRIMKMETLFERVYATISS